MKRLVAKRKLQRKCIYCNAEFKKGNVYYKQRNVYTDWTAAGDIVIAWEYLVCPKCKWKEENSNKRFEGFKKICTHPYEFEETQYGYIPGEYVMEPKYTYCGLCGKTLS